MPRIWEKLTLFASNREEVILRMLWGRAEDRFPGNVLLLSLELSTLKRLNFGVLEGSQGSKGGWSWVNQIQTREWL